MEYEIGDDPQGFPDHPEADRDGGLSEHSLLFRKLAEGAGEGHPNIDEDRLPLCQLGEVA